MTNGHSRRHEDRVSNAMKVVSQFGGIAAVVSVISIAAVTWQKVEANAEDLEKVERRFERIEQQMNQVVQQTAETKGAVVFGLTKALERLERIESNMMRRDRDDEGN